MASHETMIERCARAIWHSPAKCDLRNVTRGPCGLDGECSCWPLIVAQASAVLLALREPSEGMKLAGETALENATVDDYDNEDNPCGSHVYAAAHTTIFQAMIDAALAETL